jgi:type III restriction enzyme
MSLQLKTYQTNVLLALELFFAKSRGTQSEAETARAFIDARRESLGESSPHVLYRRFCSELPEIPQICIRIPTGGGKTLLAAHALERAARLYVGTSYPLVLWLVPSNIIRAQTLEALQKPGHPYRIALESYYPPDRLRVLDIEDCDLLCPDDFDGRAIIVVGTLQTLRVGNTAGRKIYAYKEAFEPHFARLPSTVPYFEKVGERDLAEQPYLRTSDVGRTKYSFANLLAWYRPIVIVDEAHNNGTPLSTETLLRIRPACIVEWTATPAAEQNVLYTVSAQELKSEHMIKLPIVLQGHPNWREALRDAVLTRDRLAAEAASESEYVRPIVLFQADAANGDVGVDRLKAFLVEELHIATDRIAIATGSQRDLQGIDLFSRTCQIDFVITVEALREGWDCSFAYVFATVQNIRSSTQLEQLLGRVLRLPYAAARTSEHLNRAYAHVSSPATLETADKLAELLIGMGFEEFDAISAIAPGPDDLFGGQALERREPPLVQTTLTLAKPIAEQLLAASDGTVHLERDGDNYKTVITGLLPQAAIEAAVGAATGRERELLNSQLQHHRSRAVKASSPRSRGEHLAPIPQLVLPLQGEFVLFEPAILSDLTNFSLAGRDAQLLELRDEPDSPAYLIDVDKEKVRVATERLTDQLDLDVANESIRREDVIRGLDRRLRRHDILQADMIGWIGRAIDGLIQEHHPLTWIARHVNYVSDAMASKIGTLITAAQKEAFQSTLGIADEARKPRLDAHFNFSFREDNYPARWRYDGRYTFRKHFFGPPGELDSDISSEETACAIAIDEIDDVRLWVRNLERQPDLSFWLPTSTDRFYPDFVAELTDGRILVVEYKGAHLYNNDDSREKRDIGAFWAASSKDRCKFTMVTARSAAAGQSLQDQIRAALR